MNDKPANGNASAEAKPTERAGLPVERAQETRVDLFRERQGYTSYAQEDESGFDVLRYLRLVSKYRWLIAGVSLLVFALTAAVNLTTTPLYTATSSLQIEREATKILEKGDVVAEETGGMEFDQTQAQLLQSRALAERVAAALSLGGDQAFNQREAPSLLALAKQKITRLILPVNEGDVEAGKSLEVKQSEAAGRLLQGLNTELVRGSRMGRSPGNTASVLTSVNCVRSPLPAHITNRPSSTPQTLPVHDRERETLTWQKWNILALR
jgi:succinoglycan biosynthesis transport protein ExoP